MFQGIGDRMTKELTTGSQLAEGRSPSASGGPWRSKATTPNVQSLHLISCKTILKNTHTILHALILQRLCCILHTLILPTLMPILRCLSFCAHSFCPRSCPFCGALILTRHRIYSAAPLILPARLF